MQEIVHENIKHSDFELLYGYTGAGLYFLEKEKDQYAKETIKLILDHLISKIDFKTKSPGIAHGIAGPVLFCVKCIEKDIEIDRAKKVLQAFVPEIFNIFSHNFYNSGQLHISRSKSDNYPNPLGWCHGIPGLALSIFKAGRATLQKDWMSFAIHCMKDYVFELQQNENKVKDNCLCHGITGIASILRNFYLQTKITTFLDASDYWIEKSINDSMHASTSQYTILNVQKDLDPGLLTGTAGISLSYLNVLTSDIDEPGWETCLLIN